MSFKDLMLDIAYATWKTAKSQAMDIIGTLLLAPIKKNIVSTVIEENRYLNTTRLLSARLLSKKAKDGAFLSGPAATGWAKFAIRKGLPDEGQKRMAIENPPHEVNDFSGVIKEGYGKGTKKLLFSGDVVVKIDGRLSIQKINIHEHRADRAGLHYDIVTIGIRPGTNRFEINIPRGEFKGRYAFLRPTGFNENQVLINRMGNKDISIPKPHTILKDSNWLKGIESKSGDWIVEWKPDGGSSGVIIRDDRAIFTSHREQAEPYYEKIPQLEFIHNRSSLFTSRFLFPGPDQNGTLLQGELFHPDGAARVGGIVNSGADKAIKFQQENGNITFYVYDINKLRGKDVTSLPYSKRRELYIDVVKDIRRFNKNWNSVKSITGNQFIKEYNIITNDPRGLPYSEGIIAKNVSTVNGPYYKVKHRDFEDVIVKDIIEGTGKYKGTLGRMLVETANGEGEVGSFAITDKQRNWIWRHRKLLIGQEAEIKAQDIGSTTGSPRAGVFYRWGSRSEYGLLMYSLDDYDRLYSIKSSAGWRKG